MNLCKLGIQEAHEHWWCLDCYCYCCEALELYITGEDGHGSHPHPSNPTAEQSPCSLIPFSYRGNKIRNEPNKIQTWGKCIRYDCSLYRKRSNLWVLGSSIRNRKSQLEGKRGKISIAICILRKKKKEKGTAFCSMVFHTRERERDGPPANN